MALAFHADYACGRSGVCCSSGWPIAVAAPRRESLEQALGSGRLTLDRAVGRGRSLGELLLDSEPLPSGAGARLGHDAAGRCLFLEVEGGVACAVHRRLGPEALPAACRQFPRVAVLEPGRVLVSLSHHCPTAAARLREERPALRVAAGAVAAGQGSWEGLDARGVGARLLRPGVLLDDAAFEEWERRGLERLAGGGDPDASLTRLSAAAEVARTWTPSEGALAARVAGAFGSEGSFVDRWESRLENAERVRRAAPPPWRAEAASPRAAVFDRSVRPVWRRESRLLGRYLCGRFFACWALYLGGGLRSHAAFLRLALDSLAVLAAQRAERAGAELDEAGLLEAIRENDRRLLHLAEPARLAEGLEGGWG